jgi:dihydrofolate reductase
MAKLFYTSPTSLDGFLAGENDSLDWSLPDEEFMVFITDLIRPVGTYLYGRKMYETMAVWQTPEGIPGLTAKDQDFARVWQAADKIVYSKTLEGVSTPKTRLEREFDVQAVRDLKAQLPHDISVSGPNLATHAFRAGLVDEIQLFVAPMLLGRGKRILPSDVRVRLELLEEHRFASGMMYLRYQTRD